jgi:putative membrane protein
MKKLSTSFCCGAMFAAGLMAQSMSPDSKFAMTAAHGGAAEVMMGQLAAQKATDPAVKSFGQQMVDDHSKANGQLMSVAQSESMTLPSEPDAKQKAEYAKLSSMSGPAFDKAYVKAMVKDHEEDVKDFTKESQSGNDPKIKDFATTTLPVLQGHLEKIKSIQSEMTGGR